MASRFGFRFAVITWVALVVYIPSLSGEFIWDDNLFLTENPLIRADDGLYRFWFTTEPPDYFPLVSTLLWLEWRLWGMNPTGYHVANIILHAMSSVLIWLVLRSLKIPGNWLAALIFAVHPVNVESVAWIAERKNTQSMLFYLLTILFYLKFDGHGERRWYLLSLFSFLLALLSKTSIVMLPFVLLGCVWWQRGAIGKGDVARSLPFFGLSAILGLVTIWFQYNVAIGEDIVRNDTFLERLALAGWAVWFYIYKAIVPLNLSFIYPRWVVEGPGLVSYLPLLMLFAFFLFFWWYRNGWGRPFLFGLGYFVVTLFPVLGFFDINFMRFSFVTDHWQYTSIIGVIALAVGLGSWACTRWGRGLKQVLSIAAFVLVCFLGMLTWNRCHAFKNLEALWRDTIAKNPEAWMARSNLGSVMVAQGRFDEAIAHCREALRLNPNHAWIHGALGNALVGKGRLDEAVNHFSQAIKLKPDFVDAYNDLGLALKGQGRLKEAIHQFSHAVRIKPDYARGHLNLGIALAEQGRLDEALAHFSQGVRIDPTLPDAHYNLGLALALQGKQLEAIDHLSTTVKLNPNFAEAHFNLGAVLAGQARFQEAIFHFAEALRIKPDFPQAKQYLSRALNEAGNARPKSRNLDR